MTDRYLWTGIFVVAGAAGKRGKWSRRPHTDDIQTGRIQDQRFLSFATPPPPVDTVASGDNANSPGSNPTPSPAPNSQTPQVNLISHVRHMISQKPTNFEFPPSLVFVAPPTKDSTPYPSRVNSQLLLPNSYHPLSLVDNDSVTVVSYEYFLVEYLDVLNALPPEGHESTLEVENLRNRIFDTLQYLDRSKANEWNKQLDAQLNPSTFIISGKDQCPVVVNKLITGH